MTEPAVLQQRSLTSSSVGHADAKPIALSIVSTMYRSASFLATFCERMCKAASQYSEHFELILVNDGSPDDSLKVALDLRAKEHRIQVVDLARNFGHHAAIVAGLSQSSGEKVFLIDCDLEEEPEWVLLFLDELEKRQADVVFGVQKERVSSLASNLFGTVFWTSLSFMSSVKIPHNPMTCRLMSRAYVDSLLMVGDRVLYLAGVFAWTGFRQESIALLKGVRPGSQKSTYNLSRKLVHVVDSFASFSVMPLWLIFFLGLGIWLISLLYGTFLLVEKLLNPGIILSGFTSVMVSVWFLGGSTILVLGVLGIYLAKIFQEVKRRPLYLIRGVYRGESND